MSDKFDKMADEFYDNSGFSHHHDNWGTNTLARMLRRVDTDARIEEREQAITSATELAFERRTIELLLSGMTPKEIDALRRRLGEI